MSRPLPIGVQDFRKLRKGGYTYVDKTDMIPRLLSNTYEVYLCTRPRRFGKSLNLSMLDAFFNIEYRDDDAIFDGLKVSDCEKCEKHRNAYPVVFFDFKTLGVSSLSTFEYDLRDEFSRLYGRYRYLSESEKLGPEEKGYISDVTNRSVEPVGLRKALFKLIECLHKHHGAPVVVLLDEYDNPIHNSYGKPHLDEILAYMRDILSSALKNNVSYLKFGVVTGVMQIAKESIFSGLNNLEVNNVFSRDFDEMFGFTETEVEQLLEEYGHPEKIDEVREWYDGYRFGDTDVYNPWSVLKYLGNHFKPEPYWAGTSGNDIIGSLLRNADEGVMRDLMVLSQGGSVVKRIKPSITVSDLDWNPGNIYSIMVMSGYLNAVPEGGYHALALPNGEIYEVLGDVLAAYLWDEYRGNDVYKTMSDLSRALVSNDTGYMESILYDFLSDNVGSIMLDNEHVYQAVLITLLTAMSGKYTLRSETERGMGRYDILLESKTQSNPHILIELKRSKSDASDETVRRDAEAALQQIRDKDYHHGLRGRIILYGITFRGKKPMVLSEILDS